MEFDDHRLAVGWAQHPKFQGLMEELGAGAAVAWLNLLGYAAAWAPDGCLGQLSPNLVRRAAVLALIPGAPDADQLIAYLTHEDVALIDVDEDGNAWLHDWEVHQPGIVGAWVKKQQGHHGRKGAEHGSKGAEHGHKGAASGKLGGRPRKDGKPPKSRGNPPGESAGAKPETPPVCDENPPPLPYPTLPYPTLPYR